MGENSLAYLLPSRITNPCRRIGDRRDYPEGYRKGIGKTSPGSLDEMPKPILRTDVLEMKDLTEGMVLKGTVRNVIDFGVFVDIGVHQDGLVHISEITDKKFIKHPLEVVSVRRYR